MLLIRFIPQGSRIFRYSCYPNAVDSEGKLCPILYFMASSKLSWIETPEFFSLFSKFLFCINGKLAMDSSFYSLFMRWFLGLPPNEEIFEFVSSLLPLVVVPPCLFCCHWKWVLLFSWFQLFVERRVLD